MDVNRLHYIGIFRSPVSWAKVNREFVAALDRVGLEVSVTSLRGLHYEADYPVSNRLEKLMDRPRDEGIELAMEYPENLWKLEGDLNLAWVLYETDLPARWVEAYQKHADVFLCPSAFVRQKAVAAGLPEERTAIVPFGVNMNHYHPDVEPNADSGDDMEFLTVGPPHKRKGFRELIRGYDQAFSQDDPVRLHIKTYERASDDQLYPWEFDLDAFLDRETGPRSPDIHVNRSSLDETEMACLFRSADVFVLPSYGEAFGLSVLESMAVGTPVVGVNYGPVSEMVHEENGWLVDGREVQLTGVAYDQDEPCTFCVPPSDVLGTTLRSIMDEPEQIQKRAQSAIETARDWSWDHSAEQFVQVLQSL